MDIEMETETERERESRAYLNVCLDHNYDR